jgi:hypothetical protein
METKRDKARNLIRKGNVKEALRIVKGFDGIYSKEEMRTLGIAYEALTGKASFYKQLGEDTDAIIATATKLLDKMLVLEVK